MRLLSQLTALLLSLCTGAWAVDKSVKIPQLPVAAIPGPQALIAAPKAQAAQTATLAQTLSVQAAQIEKAAAADPSGAATAQALESIYVRTAVSGEAAAAPEEPLGARTLALLDRFLGGPKASQRGDAFLYAEGAKALPAELEAARGEPSRLPGRGHRALFSRRDGRGSIQLYGPDGEMSRPIDIPYLLTRGLANETVVDVLLDGAAERALEQDKRVDPESVTALRAVGALRPDMIVGRVEKRGNELMLGSLLLDGKIPLTIYGRIPIKGGLSVNDGDIVQAFVKPTSEGYAAQPLLPMGRRITPSVVARDIAFRYGARGYFDAAAIRQAEDIAKTFDPESEFARLKAKGARVEDLRSLPFITIDPPGAADLDDAYVIRKEADGGYTWYLATALVAPYIKPGTPAFQAAMRAGNTLYSNDKNGIGAYPMNHPVVSMHAASLLEGKKSLAMVTKMRFGPDGAFKAEDSDVFLGLMESRGRYTYDQVTDMWKGKPGHGIAHEEQVNVARELAAKLDAADGARGKLDLDLNDHDPVEQESHRLIEKLKVYGNLALHTRLQKIRGQYGLPFLGRAHPPKDEKANARLAEELAALGLPWDEQQQSLSEYLRALKANKNVDEATKKVARTAILRTRSRARYTVGDLEGHEGLGFEPDQYDHPSTPIRRAGDMYHNTLLTAYLQGDNPREAYAAVLKDLRGLGFADLGDYARHLNARQNAGKRIKREEEEFNALYELAKPEYAGRALDGYVVSQNKRRPPGFEPEVVVQLRGSGLEIRVRGPQAMSLNLRDDVKLTIRSINLGRLTADMDVQAVGKDGLPLQSVMGRGDDNGHERVIEHAKDRFTRRDRRNQRGRDKRR